MAKSRRERYPYCGFLDVIKWENNAVTRGINVRTAVAYLHFAAKMSARPIVSYGLNGGSCESRLFLRLQSLVDAVRGSYIVGLTSILKTIPHGIFRDEKKSIF